MGRPGGGSLRAAVASRMNGSAAPPHDPPAREALVIDSVPGLVAILTPTGEVDDVNARIIEYCGLPLETMKHWGSNGIVHAEDVLRIVPVFTHAITTGVPYDFDARIRRFDGIYRWFQVRGHPLSDVDGSIARWYVLLTDIDDLKRTQEELRRGEAFLGRVQQLSATGGFIGGPPRARCSGRSRSTASSSSSRPHRSPRSCVRAESTRTTFMRIRRASSWPCARPAISSMKSACSCRTAP